MKRKGVSPAIATVILVAVAITVSVGVSYWMSTFVTTSPVPVKELAIIRSVTYGFETNNPENIIVLDIRNLGLDTINITDIFVNNLTRTFSGNNLIGDDSILIVYNAHWTSGEICNVAIETKKENLFYSVTTPP